MPATLKDKLKRLRVAMREESEIRAAARAGTTPPKFMWTMVGGPEGFLEQGRAFSAYLIEHGELTPSSSVLDIGCGLGKYAVHLAAYLNGGGRLEGFDVEKRSIDWCRRAITPRYPNARFRHTPLQSEMYSPRATARAAQFVFPYGSAEFDFTFLASVFTHMFAADVENYVTEIARVLKPGGRCVTTMYLLNDASRAGIAAGTAAFDFAIEHGGCWIWRPDPPEAAVAYEEPVILDMFARAGMELAEPIRYGVWPTTGHQDQDFLILRKR